MFPPALRLQGCAARRFVSSVSSQQVFTEGDHVLLRRLRGTSSPILTHPLDPSKRTDTPYGHIPHSSILGHPTRKLISSHKGAQYCATFPTIEEYVTKVRRLVTPVYPLDAATIVTLLDIHAAPPPTERPFEVLEAGTGHGSLTLQLCRAIHAANPPGAPRSAVVHSIDISPKHSAHARKVVNGFRRGLYSGDVDFHVGDPSSWVLAEQARRRDSSSGGGEQTGEQTGEQGQGQGEFLAHALLDLPAPEQHLAVLASALLPDGVLGVFCPSVTQIGDCLRVVKKAGLRLGKEMIVEFPPHAERVGAGLRGWNVKYVVVRAKAKEAAAAAAGAGGEAEAEAEVEVEVEAEAEEGVEGGQGEGAEIQSKEIPALEEGETEEVLVCRPSVGERLVGGGFFAIFRKQGEC